MNKTILAILILVTGSLDALSQSNTLYKNSSERGKTFLNSAYKISDDDDEEEDDIDREFTCAINTFLWLISMNGSTYQPLIAPGQTKTPSVKVKYIFSDAFKYFKYAAMLEGYFKYKRMSLMYDISYVDANYGGSASNSGYKDGDLQSQSLVADVCLGYGFKLKRHKKVKQDAYAGVRIYSLNNTIDLITNANKLITTETSELWFDPIVGASTQINFSDNWFSHLKADVGGFGITSRLSYHLFGTLGFRLSKRFNTSVGVKFRDVNHDKDNFLWNAAHYGFLFSLGYNLD